MSASMATYYFNSDSAGAAAAAAAAIPTNIVLDGWSARATGGLSAKFGNGAMVAVGAERAESAAVSDCGPIGRAHRCRSERN